MSLKRLTMDINKQWQKLEQANFNQTIKKEEIMKAIKLESTSTIAAIKKGLKQKINWAKFFAGLFVGVALVNYSNVGVVALMTIATIVYLLGVISLTGEYKKMNLDIDSDDSVLENMKINLNAIKSALSKERIFGILAFPVMLVVGLTFTKLRNGENILDILSPQYSLVAIMVLIVMILLLGFGAEKMNKMAFGGHISKLENQIRDLEKIS